MASRDFATTTELRGLALPASPRGAGGYFEAKDPLDAAWGDLLMALLVPVGSRPMNRTFGSALYDTLFTPQTLEFEVVVVAIRDAAARLLPHIVIKDVTVIADTPRHVRVGIVFALASDRGTEEERAVLIDKTHIGILAAS